MADSNLKIVQRLLELAKNQPGYNEERPLFPKSYDTEQIWLANVLNDSRNIMEREFKEEFQRVVAQYKMTLKEGKGYGWFHSPEKLEWIKMQINQLKYVVYGEEYIREIKFNDSLKNKAYKDFIEQIDRTVLMTPAQLKKHDAEINRISKEVMAEILKEESK